MLSALVFPGGYGDAGGLTANGELPEVEPVQIRSENELKSKIAAIAKELDLKNDWEARCKVSQCGNELWFCIIGLLSRPLSYTHAGALLSLSALHPRRSSCWKGS